MLRRIQFQRLWLAIPLLALALTGCGTKEDRIASHLRRGQDYLAQSNREKALIEVRNVIQIDPKNAQAYFLAGQVEESRGELQKAYSAYTKAVELAPTLWNAKVAIARLQFMVGDDHAANQTLDAVATADPANPDAAVVRAGILVRRGDPEGALAAAGQIKDPEHLSPPSILILANIYGENHDLKRALELLEAGLGVMPKDSRLLQAAARASGQLNEIEKASGYYGRAAAAAPQEFALWKEWASFLEARGQVAQAEDVLRKSIQANSDDTKRYLALTAFLFQHGGPDAARKALLGFANDRPQDSELQFGVVNFYESQGEMDQAKAVLNTLAAGDKTAPATLRAQNELAAFDLAEGKEGEARNQLDAILKANPRDSTALVQRGRLELLHHQNEPALIDLRAAAKERPDAAPVVALLAEAYRANQQADLARDTIIDSARLFPNHPELTMLEIQGFLTEGKESDAMAAADSLIQANPRDWRGYEIKAGLQTRAHDNQGAEATLKSYTEKFPQDPSGYVHLGQFYMTQKQFDLAAAQFDHAVTDNPKAFEPRAFALDALLKAGHADLAQKRVATSIASEPNSGVNYLLLGTLKSEMQDPTGAEAAFRHASELDPTLIAAYLRVAEIRQAAHDSAGAEAILDTALKANPSNDALALAEADFYSRSGLTDRAVTTYRTLLQRDPGYTMAANNLAYLLLQRGDKDSLDQALVLSKRFEYSTNAALLDTLGWTDYKLGRYADAVPILKRAESIAPNTPVVELHYGLALYHAGPANVDDAKQHLRLAMQSGLAIPGMDEAKEIVGRG